MGIKDQYPSYTFSKFFKEHKKFVLTQSFLLVLGLACAVYSHLNLL